MVGQVWTCHPMAQSVRAAEGLVVRRLMIGQLPLEVLQWNC
jgi:hypothetical protein